MLMQCISNITIFHTVDKNFKVTKHDIGTGHPFELLTSASELTYDIAFYKVLSS